MPGKVHIEQTVGNSNKQNIEVLQPKWVAQRQNSRSWFKKLDNQQKRVEEKSTIVFKPAFPEIFEKQLPTLVAAYGLYTDKSHFKNLAVPMLDPEAVSERFTRSFILSREQTHLIIKYAQMMQIDGKKLSNQIRISAAIKYNISGGQNSSENEKQLKFLKKVPVKIDLLNTAECREITAINTLIFEANHVDY